MFGLKFLRALPQINMIVKKTLVINQTRMQQMHFYPLFCCSNTKNYPDSKPEIQFNLHQEKGEDHKITFENKTFTAKIGDKVLTYTIDEETIKGAKYGKGDFYVLMFTCEVCETKSVRSISKQAYHQGVVLVRCEGCDKIHLMADNLGWFEDKPVNVEELMRRKNKPMLKVTNNVEIANILSKFLQKREEDEEKKKKD